MNQKTKYTVLIIGLLVGIILFTIVITIYKKNKFSKGDDSNSKVGDNKKNEKKDADIEQDENNINTPSQDSKDSSSNNNLTPEDFLTFLPEQIEKLDLNFKKLAEYLKIEDQTTFDQLFEELNKAAPEKRLEIVEKYKQNNEEIDNWLWAKEGFQAGKNIFINVFSLVKNIAIGLILLNFWIHRKMNNL